MWRAHMLGAKQYKSSTQRTQPHTTSHRLDAGAPRGATETQPQQCGGDDNSHAGSQCYFTRCFPGIIIATDCASAAMAINAGHCAAGFVTDFWFWFLPFLCSFFVFYAPATRRQLQQCSLCSHRSATTPTVTALPVALDGSTRRDVTPVSIYPVGCFHC